ncbi:MAG: chromosome segregation ATPase, partial [Cyanobacteria bacterium CAN_BIN43]|nr:chromosome segregation ATPase [Cyanobacteria bacterium CAN_BIN43]
MKLRLPPAIAEHFSGSKPVYWRLWIAVSVMLPGSAALWAATQLLWLPDLPNCWLISWSDASAATRLYCAQELGNRQTPEDLHQSIRLLNRIEVDDPLRPEG